MKTLRSIVLAILAMPALLSQTFTGTISGVVTDPNAATIPGASVRTRNEATGDVRQVSTGGDGLFVFSQLPPGNYEVSVEIKGFRKSVQTGAALRVNQTLEMNFAMQLGEVNQTVEVAASVTLLDTQSANRAVTLDQQAMLDLPTNARNLSNSSMSTPASSPCAPASPKRHKTRITTAFP